MAHYYFGHIYKAKTTLFWLQLESFAEFFSLKYQIESKISNAPSDKYEHLKKTFSENPNHHSFVRIDEITEADQINNNCRYDVIPFQLLGIEHIIGEEKMMAFIKAFLRDEEEIDGYKSFKNNLEKVDVSKKQLHLIEEKYIKSIDLNNYKFVEKMIE